MEHRCAECELEYANVADYLAHVCEQTGHKPTEVEHQDALTNGAFSKQSEKALERGAARVGEVEHPSVDVARNKGEKVNAADAAVPEPPE